MDFLLFLGEKIFVNFSFLYQINMNNMIVISLVINIVVLVPICFGMFSDANWVREAYGAQSLSRGILLSIYLAILLGSAWLLFGMDVKFVTALLLIQILYKITTPFTVGTLKNPVVVSNLLIAIFHTATVYTIWDAGRLVSN